MFRMKGGKKSLNKGTLLVYLPVGVEDMKIVSRISDVGHSSTSFPRAVKTELLLKKLEDIASPLYDITDAGFECVSQEGEKWLSSSFSGGSGRCAQTERFVFWNERVSNYQTMISMYVC